MGEAFQAAGSRRVTELWVEAALLAAGECGGREASFRLHF
jgi:hypothetical protein